MLLFQGKSLTDGVAVGKVFVYKKQEYELQQTHIEDTEAEWKRFEAARENAAEQLRSLATEAEKQVGKDEAQIFEMHAMMLEDLDYIESVENFIKNEKWNAEYAVHETGQNFSELFASLEDEYMKGRAVDVLDVSKRVIHILAGIDTEGLDFKEPVILLAEDLTPSETIQMDKSKILAFVTIQGSVNSHTAILARTMNIPALVKADVELLKEYHNRTAFVDGETGRFGIDPTQEELAVIYEKQKHYQKMQEELNTMIGRETVTKHGKKINLYANIGNAEDVDKVLENDGEGIGLFRSEFLYLGNSDYPGEEEQFQVYKEVLSKMQGKRVIIRTLDIGADKQADYFGIPHEENPAMGYRAIRICLDRIEVFKTQLRAIYRASAFGRAAIMFPMIISVDEVIRIKEIVEQVKAELIVEGREFDENVELGIMVETPASVFISEDLAKEVQFFSIGTNDLTQYMLAIDRQNQNLDAYYNPHHKAVLKAIETTVQNGHKAGIWVGICGELGGDLSLTDEFIRMGVDELSVSAGKLLKLRKKIRESDAV